ncbi:MAG: formylmethanofuran dehydrogenase subunit B, partial [Planctomyces sp.]
MTSATTHTAIACTQCGCVCDDLTIQTDERGVSAFQPACPIADRWYQAFRETPNGVPVTIGGKPSPLNEGIIAAVDLLTRARSPLIYGLSRSSTGGQRAACRLADCLQAAIDTTASTCHAPSSMALPRVGEETATLGEIKNRSD